MSTCALPVELQNLPTMGKKLKQSTVKKYRQEKNREAISEATAGLNTLRLVSPARMRAQQAALSHIAEYDLKDTPETREILIQEFMECEL